MPHTWNPHAPAFVPGRGWRESKPIAVQTAATVGAVAEDTRPATAQKAAIDVSVTGPGRIVSEQMAALQAAA